MLHNPTFVTPFIPSTWDPVAVGVTVGILAMAGLVACAWPARYAVRADPARALRD